MATKYNSSDVNSSPVVSGRFLAHNRFDPIGRAFIAADLHAGRARLCQPTIVQVAFLARVNRTYAHYAFKRMHERAEIEAGLIPLVPKPIDEVRFTFDDPPPTAVDPVPPLPDDSDLIRLVRWLGVNRVLDAVGAADSTIMDFNGAAPQTDRFAQN